MSQQIQVDFECYACGSVNPTHIIKPKPFQPTTAKRKCEVCESEFTISFKLASGKPGQVVYGFLANAMNLSDEGKKLLNERNNNAQPIPVDETQEVQNANM
jgi:hypothetical protein